MFSYQTQNFVLFLVLRNITFLPFSVVHGSFYQDHTSRNYFTETHEQERGNQAGTRLSKSLMDVSYKIKVLLWTIFLLSLSVTLRNLGRGTKRKEKDLGFVLQGWNFLIKITLTKSPLKEPPRYHLMCSQTNITILETLGFDSLQCI